MFSLFLSVFTVSHRFLTVPFLFRVSYLSSITKLNAFSRAGIGEAKFVFFFTPFLPLFYIFGYHPYVLTYLLAAAAALFSRTIFVHKCLPICFAYCHNLRSTSLHWYAHFQTYSRLMNHSAIFFSCSETRSNFSLSHRGILKWRNFTVTTRISVCSGICEVHRLNVYLVIFWKNSLFSIIVRWLNLDWIWTSTLINSELKMSFFFGVFFSWLWEQFRVFVLIF